MSEHIQSYPSIYAIGHRAIAGIFTSPCVIEEKVDGSQFSMSRTGGVLSCRSKGRQLSIEAPEKMFLRGVESAKALDLCDGWVYRCEYLNSPKHNTQAYERVPKNNLIVFDVMTGPETYLTPTEKRWECDRLGLECVPCFYNGFITNAANWISDRGISKAWMEELLHNDSVLGGCKVEVVVIKNYSVFTPEKKIAIAKYVSEAFKEKHLHEWKKSNPTQTDIIAGLISELKTDARWEKVVQHLRDDGKLTGELKDIGPLMRELQEDTKKEEADYIKEKLFNHFWPHINRGVTNGFPEFYKAKVGVNQFTA